MFQIGIDSFIHAITGLLKVRNILFNTNLIEIMINSFELMHISSDSQIFNKETS